MNHQDPDILARYIAARQALDDAAMAGDQAAFEVAKRPCADATQDYVDDLERIGFTAPHGLREEIANLRRRP